MRRISPGDMAFLEAELAGWLEAGLVDEGQADGIRGLYAVEGGRVLVAAGALAAGLGALCFAAGGWAALGRMVVALRGWAWALMRLAARWGVGVAMAGAALAGAGLSLLPAGRGALVSSFGLGLAGAFGLALTYPACWGGVAFAGHGALAAGAAALMALVMARALLQGRVAGGVWLALLAVRWLFDGGFSLAARGWAFTAVGALAVGAGLWRH